MLSQKLITNWVALEDCKTMGYFKQTHPFLLELELQQKLHQKHENAIEFQIKKEQLPAFLFVHINSKKCSFPDILRLVFRGKG